MTSDITPQDAVVLSRLIPLVVGGTATTRPALEVATGLGRRVVSDRIRQAMDAGILEDAGIAAVERGRAPRLLRLAEGTAVILAAHLGRESAVAVCDLGGRILRTESLAATLEDGPQAVIAEVVDGFERVLRKTANRTVWGIGIAVPGPVDVASHRLVQPASMPGWDDVDVRNLLRASFDAPIWVENDANVMALAEYRTAPAPDRDLLYVKVGTSIGSGMISGGRIHRGAGGAAGEIGHVRARSGEERLCRCGLVGCLETVAAGWAIVERLTERAPAESTFLSDILRTRPLQIDDVIGAIDADDALTLSVVDRAATEVAEAVADIVNFANPGTVVLGGGATRLRGRYFSTFESSLPTRIVPLAARSMTVRAASLDFREGLIGAALLASDHLFARDALLTWLPHGSPSGQATRLHRLTAA
ncbi:ROK family protein [Microbacterium aurantiacum]|uniref:ROK family protein n=1 Tax=Microbacterium aurantiacum TaxID=162393 RepID=A0AAJ2HK17_9MICO|nr:ROK family protein [Microbacterium aurantiacum]MDS0244298.1 ROK family protein [Microbacterium aurantiacum]